jgi:hypothetical protein
VIKIKNYIDADKKSNGDTFILGHMQLFDKLERFRNHLFLVSGKEINQNFDDALQWYQDRCIKYNIEGLNKLHMTIR